MSYAMYKHLSDLRYLIADLGRQGGVISASIYDTAQVLRFLPGNEQPSFVLRWLMAQQQSDGGWGNPAMPRARDIPTLATLLALHSYQEHPGVCDSIVSGIAFLQQHAPAHWGKQLPDDIPVGAELLLPSLLEEVPKKGLHIPRHPYVALIELGNRRRRLIEQMRPKAGSAPTHSWEAWGTTPDPFVVDGTGGVGHSPAATAAWLRVSAEVSHIQAHAKLYLEQATTATCFQYPGMMPTVWPIDRFEQIWVLYALFVGGLLEHPQLAEAVRSQLDDLAQALGPTGIGMSDEFIVDGDITATTIAVLKAAGYAVNSSILKRFQQDDHYFTYPHELQPSLTTTAHAVLALALCGEDVTQPVRFLTKKRLPDGRWAGDKWHASWLYTTAQVVTALTYAGQFDAIGPAVDALLREQHADGGWGMDENSTTAETAYVTLALHSSQIYPAFALRVQNAIDRAGNWLANYHDLSSLGDDMYWIGKELYCPYRVDHAYVLSAIAALSGAPVLARSGAYSVC